MDYYKFEEKIKYYLKEDGRSQASIARKLDYAPDTFNKWVRCVNRMPDNVIYAFCELLNLNDSQRAELLELAGYSVPPRPNIEQNEVIIQTTDISRSPKVAINLPIQLTSFVGREHEIQTIQDLLLRQDVRLVTLTGPGGVGKTRLCIEVSKLLRERFSAGVFFVSLSPLQLFGQVVNAIAQVLSLQDVYPEPSFEHICEHLRTKSVLLVLDNFEHIIAARTVISDLLSSCPQLCILITSREGLRIRGEHEFVVTPLPLPALERSSNLEPLASIAAIDLFLQRTQSLKPDFLLNAKNAHAVAEICINLDGLPLAIELAAARIKLFSPQAMLEQLENRFRFLRNGPRDLPDRQHTLRATLDWSYDLLAEDDKILFRRLAIFVGGCSLEAVEQVCGFSNDETVFPLSIDIIDGLTSLVDKSMLFQEPGADGESRFAMLMSIREYARELLFKSQEMSLLQSQHALYYRALVERAEPELAGQEQRKWLNQLEQDHDNIRAVLSWAIEHREAELGARVGGALWRFWERHGHLAEGRIQLEKILAMSSDVTAHWRAKALHATGNLMRNQGDYIQAKAYYKEALTLRRELKIKQDIVASLHGWGNVAYDLGDYHEAVPILEEALSLWQELGNEWGVALEHLVLGEIAWCQANYRRAMELLEEGLILYEKQKDTWGIAIIHINIGQVLRDRGKYEEATISCERGLDLLKEIGHKRGIGLALTYLASVMILQGNYREATSLLKESLALFQEQKEKWGIAHVFNYLGQISTYQGELETAKSYYEDSINLYQETGDKRATAMALKNQATLSLHQNNYTAAEKQAIESLALSNQVGNKLGIALALYTLAQVAACQNEFERAIKLEGAAETLREMIKAPLPTQEKLESEQTMKLVHAYLDEHRINVLWGQGRSLEISEAISLAMDK